MGYGREVKPSLQWALDTLRSLSQEEQTATVTIRLVNGGVQGMSVNQDLTPQRAQVALVEHNRAR
jgi:hypothetical protein